MENEQFGYETVTVDAAAKKLEMPHILIYVSIASGKLKWTPVDGKVHVVLPQSKWRLQELVEKLAYREEKEKRSRRSK